MKSLVFRRWLASLSERRSPQIRSMRVTISVNSLEDRVVPSGAADITGLTALRADPAYADIDGALPGRPQNIGVAVLDTGLFGNHPDLRGNVVAYYDAVTNSNTSGTVITDPAQMTSSKDPNGHGSHVAGTVGSTNPAIGVATGVDLIGVRVLPAAGENPRHDALTNGLNWVAENQQRYNIRVVNMSLGTPSNVNDPNQSANARNGWAQAIRRLEGLGITVVTASGNSYGQFVSLGSAQPGAMSTITVANTWEDNGVGDTLPNGGGAAADDFYGVDRVAHAGQLSATSQRSTLPNQVAAPGTTIYSTWNGATDRDGRPKNYNTISGTSMAAPFVTGVVALMQDAAFTASGRYLSPEQTLSILRSTADQIVDSPSPDNYRLAKSNRAETDLPETGATFFRVNAQRAVAQARAEVGGGSGGGGGGGGGSTSGSDGNNKRETAVAVPNLDGNRIFTFNGNIGKDGSTSIGNNDVDLFAVTVKSKGTLLGVTLQPNGGTAFDSYIRIFDQSGSQIAFNDDLDPSQFGAYAGVGVDVVPGTYYIGISSFINASYNITDGSGAASGSSSGDYLLAVQLNNPDPNGVFTGAVNFPTDEYITSIFDDSFTQFDDAGSGVTGKAGYLVTGTIGSDPPPDDGTSTERVQIGSGDVDMFRYVVPDSGRLYVRIASQGRLFNPFDAPLGSSPEFSPFDTYLRIFDADGNQLAFDDDSATAQDSEYVLNGLSKGQVVYFAVSNYASRGYDAADPNGRPDLGTGGYYELFSTFDNGDLNGTAFNAVPLPSIGTPAGGTIGTDFAGPIIGTNGSLDVDFVQVTAPSDGYFRVTGQGVDGFVPNLAIWGFKYDAGGNVTDFTKIASSSLTKSVTTVRVTANTVYFISVTGQGNAGFNWYDTASGTGGTTGDYKLTTEILSEDAYRGGQDKGVRNGAPPRIITLGDTALGDIGSDFSADGTEYITDYSTSSSIMYGAGDIDTYQFTPTTTGRVRFYATASSELGGGTDPVMRVFDVDGNELAFNDDESESSRNSLIEMDVVAGQTYYVGITGYSEDAPRYNILTGEGPAALATASVGPYSLQITDATPRLNNPPTAGNDATSTALNTTVTINVLANDADPDGDPLSVTVATAPANGSVVVNADKTIAYSPNTGFSGSDSFTYTVSDGKGGTTNATVTVTVGPVRATALPKLIAVGGGAGSGTVRFLNPDQSERFSITPFGSDFTGGVRTASGDFNRDGVDDLVVGTGPGIATKVLVIDGKTQEILKTFEPFESGFTGGVYVATGDINGDGVPDVVITPDEGGGPRARIFSGNGFGQLADFYGIDDKNFRGGARASLGDINGDGRLDLIIVAGFGGGPRVAIFDGKALGNDGGPKLTGDFFAFEESLRNGIFVTAGDVDGDGYADLVAGGGPGGGPRVSVFDGKDLLSGTQTRDADFFAGDDSNRGGVRLTAKDLDGDGHADIITGSGTGAGAGVKSYAGSTLSGTNPPELFDFDGIPGFGNGVYVG